jgi:hypothetical protein
MGWYRCSCGFTIEATPRLGDSIVSVNHLHRAARVDGTSAIVRMEEILDPVRAPTREASVSQRGVDIHLRLGRRAA